MLDFEKLNEQIGPADTAAAAACEAHWLSLIHI